MLAWVGRRTDKVAWFLFGAALVVIILAGTGQEKLQWDLAAPTAGTPLPAPGLLPHDAQDANSNPLLTHALQREEAAGATALPEAVVPATDEAEDKQEWSGWSGGMEQEASAMEDDDGHGLFAEELRADDDDDDDDDAVVGHRTTATSTTTVMRSSSSRLTVAECVASYGQRHFLREEQRAAPPILYSFPGASFPHRLQQLLAVFSVLLIFFLIWWYRVHPP